MIDTAVLELTAAMFRVIDYLMGKSQFLVKKNNYEHGN